VQMETETVRVLYFWAVCVPVSKGVDPAGPCHPSSILGRPLSCSSIHLPRSRTTMRNDFATNTHLSKVHMNEAKSTVFARSIDYSIDLFLFSHPESCRSISFVPVKRACIMVHVW